MKIVVSDPKTRKAYNKTLENPAAFSGKRIGEEVELGLIGMEGYKAKITGGSDKQGIPMKHDLQGTGRRKVVITLNRKEGETQKVSRRGNTISGETAQLNLKIVKEGANKLEELLGGEHVEASGEKTSFKEKAVKESLENVGKISAEEAKTIKKAK